MSANTPPTERDGTTPPVSAGVTQGLRFWPVVAILMLQLVTLVLTVTPSINNALRFGIMMLGPAVCGILFTIWLLFASRMRWRDRLGILAGTILAGVCVSQLIDSTMGVAMWIYGVPLVMGLAAAAIWLVRPWHGPRRISGVLLAVVCGWSIFLLARLDGFDGSYWPELRWRWSLTADQRLAGSAPSIAPEVAASPAMLRVGTTDWPGFRGSARQGQIKGIRLDTDWDANPPRELWRIPVGPAWSSFAHIDGRLFSHEQRGEYEVVVCYEADTGAEIWRHADASRFADVVSGPGPRATPTFAEGRLYTLGGRALLNCLDAVTGRLLWQRDLMAELDAPLPVWGFAASPLVTEGVVIIYAGGSQDRGLVAYDAATGAPAWQVAAGGGMNFSSAQPATFADRQLVLLASTNRLMAVEPASGNAAWEHTLTGRAGMAMIQPQQLDATRVITPLGDGGGLACIDVEFYGQGWSIHERWSSRDLKPSFNDFVAHDGYLYGFDQNIFACLDATTGQRRWKRGRYGFGQVVLFVEQDLLLITTEAGELVLIEANPDQHRELARIEAVRGKTWNHPIVAGGRLYVRNSEEAVCYQLPVAVE